MAAIWCLLTMAAAAQTKPDFSGVWELDKASSKLGEMSRIEEMVMTVSQTEKELKVETKVKRMPPPDGQRQGGMGRGPGMGGGMLGGMLGDGTATYNLDGKETKITQETPMGSVPIFTKAKIDDKGKLKISRTSSISTPMGEFALTMKETWSLSEDGKTLTVKRDLDTPRGTNSMEMVFTKK